ncbi:RIP metalloprotease RseP [bacterium]|nr:RIP metalloprotease RseP [bacterium]
MITTILATAFVLGVLIFIHELGHFLAAKLSGMRVDRFSLGYPPRLVGKKIGDTDYCVSAIPLGGYVKIAGMVDESMDTKQLAKDPQPWEFRSKPIYKRMATILAGPFMNILLAFVIFVSAVWIYGVGEVSEESVVGSVLEGKPAAAAGLKDGDRILRINGEEVADWKDMTVKIQSSQTDLLEVEFLRNDTLRTAMVSSVMEDAETPGEAPVRRIGIMANIIMRKAGFFEAFARGGENIYHWTALIINSLAKLITGKESLRSLAGPVAIAKIAGESARTGFSSLVGFLAILSLNLGLLNLLPFPVLDGGHLVMLALEGLFRREIPVKVKLIIQQVGMVLLLGLMLFVVYSDILRVTKH